MIKPLTFVLSLITVITVAQSQETKDSLIHEMCKTISRSAGQSDSSRIFLAYDEHLYPFLDKYAEGQREEIANSLFFRMQSTCGVFKEMLLKAEPPKDEWEMLIARPTKFPDKKTCRSLLNRKKYMYYESTGDTVNLTIKDSYWTDHFKDGTYSKLKMYWLTDCEFEIEFIESNNSIRKSLSKKGDRYKYYIINQEKGHYFLAVDINETDKVIGFKLYY